MRTEDVHGQTRIRPAAAEDLPRLLLLMREFYGLEHLPWDEARSAGVLRQLLEDDRLGRAVLFECGAEAVGYMVLTHGFSLEFHGRDALIDELFVVESHRGRGIGSAALAHAREVCRALGIRALHLEVDHVNVRAHELYRRTGFRDHPRYWMTWWVDPA